jgi:hypothetical protein
MKITLRAFLGAVLGLLCATAHAAGNLKLTLAPAAAISAGAQWRVDGGTWQASGATVKGLVAGSHNVDFQIVPGWIAPAPLTASITNGGTTTLTATYIQAATLRIDLTPSQAQWRIDGGAWRASGTTATGLMPDSHTIEYAALSGYATAPSESVTLSAGQALTLARAYVQLASVSITLMPANAQWRVDGGAWLASGAVAANLSPGAHAIEYAALNGYTAPAAENVALTSGQALVLTRSYIQLAQITVTLSAATAQWRVDGGAWQVSGATVANLSPATHSIEYLAVAGYTSPANESVTLTSGQSLVLTRAYIQLAQVSIALTPANAQWRVDGGAWLASGTVAANLAPGAHTIDYAAVAGFITPASESVNLASGQSLALTRAYVQLAQLSITLTPSTGEWRVDGGAWQSSGATVANLTPGDHAVDYSAVAYYQAPAAETVALAAGQSLTVQRSYTALQQILIALVPSSGQWRLNGGSWQASGTTLLVPPGTYAIDYSAIELYDAPPSETLTAGFAGTRYYTSQKPTLRIHLAPNTGQWRLDGGAWQPGGTTLTELSAGTHAVDYTDIGGDFAPLASETLSLALREHATLTRTYPWKSASVTVTTTPNTGQWILTGQISTAWQASGTTVSGLAPANNWSIQFSNIPNYTAPATIAFTLAPGEAASFTRAYTPMPASLRVSFLQPGAQWRAYPAAGAPSGTWNNSSILLTGLTPGDYVVEYSAVANYNAPPTEVVALSPNQTLEFVRTYTANPAELSVVLNPASAQWRLDGGAWTASGATISGVAPGQHSVEYSYESGYQPQSGEGVTLTAGQSLTLTRTYTPTPQLTVSLSLSAAQWRIDGGAWRDTGTSIYGFPAGNHLVEYSSVPDYVTPAAENVTFTLGESLTLQRNYTPLARLSISVNPSNAQWRVDGGAWQTSNATLGVMYDVPHTIEYSAVVGFVAPPAETVTLSLGQYLSLYRSYTMLSQVTVNVYPSNARWRINGGAWQVSGATVANLTYDVPHAIDYETVTGYVAPPSETVTLYSGQSLSLYRYHTMLSQVTVNVYPSNARWRINGGAWQVSGATAANLAYDVPHAIDYETVTGYVAPPSETVTLYSGQLLSLYRYYASMAQLAVNLYPSNAEWRIDGGAWQPSGAYVGSLTADVPHTVQFRPLQGYSTPAPQTVTFYSGELRTMSVSYPSLGVHRLRLFVHQDLAGTMPIADVRSRLAQYASQLTQVFSRETLRLFAPFDPQADISVVSADPFSGSFNGWMPDAGFELWVYATLTDQPAVGTYGGSAGVDSSGAGGARGVKWDQIHDPATLTNGTAVMAQYWRQLHLVLRQFEATFGAGAGDYASLGGLHDASATAPVIADVAAVDSAAPDAFWTARFDYWSDPLTANAYANARLGSPTSLPMLLNLTSFAPVSRAMINGTYRNPDTWTYYTLPNLSAVVVKVVDAQSGAPISGGSVRVWNRQSPTAPNSTYEETVTASSSPGAFTFSWSGTPPLDNNSNAKLVKAYAPGYNPSAQWITVYDAQAARLIEGKSTFEVTIALTHQ